MSFLQEMTAAYNDMLNVKTSLGYCRHNYAFHISPFIEFCAENYPNATEITKEMIDQWLVSKTFNADNTRRIAIINIRHFPIQSSPRRNSEFQDQALSKNAPPDIAF